MKTLIRCLTLVLTAALIVSVSAVLSGSAGAAPSTTVAVKADADTFVNQAHPWRHYGGWSSLRLGKMGGRKTAYLHFTIPDSYAGRVTSANLVLTRTTHHFPSTHIRAYSSRTWWHERTLSAAHAPRHGAYLGRKWVNHSRTTATINVTHAVQGHKYIGIALASSVRHHWVAIKSRGWSAGPILKLTLSPQRAVQGTGSTSHPSNPTPAPSTSTPTPAPSTSTPTPAPSTSTPTPAPSTSTPTPAPSTSTPTPAPSTSTPTPAPSTSTPTPAPTSSAPSNCTVSTKLVPSCQVWFGDTPQAYTHSLFTAPARLAVEEAFSGRKFDILHEYSTNDKLFPGALSIGLANQGRLLSENWKPATDMTWAQVAAGKADNRIDAEAAYLKSNFNRPFFLTIYHEPEDNVINTPGSGMTVADYVAMYRHTILRLRAQGATMFTTVMNYMGYQRWDSMRNGLYPGDDVVDWIAYDPYMFNPGNTSSNDFAALVNGPNTGNFYTWATTTHPGKPLMIAEWGAYDDKLASNPNGPAQFYGTIANQISRFPALKALDHFTMEPYDVAANSATAPTLTAAGLAAWKLVGQAPIFNETPVPTRF